MQRPFFDLRLAKKLAASGQAIVKDRDKNKAIGLTSGQALSVFQKLKDCHFEKTERPVLDPALKDLVDALDVYKMNWSKTSLYIKFGINAGRFLIIVSFHN